MIKKEQMSVSRRILMVAGSAGLMAALFLLIDGHEGLGIFLGSIESLRLLVFSAAVAAVGGCVVFALFSALTGRSWSRVFTGSCFLAFPGFLAALFCAGKDVPALLFVLSGVLFGLGLCFICGRWMLFLADFKEANLLRYLSLGLVVAALFKSAALFAAEWISIAPFLAVSIALATIGVIAPFGKDVSAREERSDDLSDDLKAMFGINWILIAGLLLCVYVIAATWSAVFEGSTMASNPQIEGIWGSTVGLFIAGITFLLVGRKDDRKVLSRLAQITPLICVTALLLAWFLGSWDSELGRFLSNIPIGFSVAAMGILLCLQMRKELWKTLPTILVFSLNALVVVGFLVIVAALWPFVGDTVAQSIHLSLMVIYLLVVAVLSIMKGGSRADRSSTEGHDISKVVSQISDRYALSAREAEILEFLIQGRSAPYISKELYVSVNTTKTHMKRIYQKMDVHSREELLDLYYTTSER